MHKLNTKFSTKVTMYVAEVVCRVWKYGRCNVRRLVNDFDYHITDLRSQYPNELSYQMSVGKLPFICKTVEVDDAQEKTSSIKIGDCNIRYSIDKFEKAGIAKNSNVVHLHDPRVSMITELLTDTKIRHNKPSLRVLNLKRKENDVVTIND